MGRGGWQLFLPIKTEISASQVVAGRRGLFQAVMEMRLHELRAAHQKGRKQLQAWTPPTDSPDRVEILEVFCSSQGASNGENPVQEATPAVDDSLGLQAELDCLLQRSNRWTQLTRPR